MNKKQIFYFIASVMLSIIFVCNSSADEIVLDNGDRITGAVIRTEGGVLTLETTYSEPVKIKKDRIVRITTDQPVEIHLTSGEILKGRVESVESGSIVVEPSEGREAAVVSWNNVAAINPEPPAPTKWKGSVNIGASMQTGNTDRTSSSIGLDAVRKSQRERYSLRFLFNYAEDNDQVTARNTFGTGKYDYFFTEKMYGYLSVELLNDRFKNLNLRTVAGPGAGYQIWDDDVRSLLFEGGLSYFSEDLREGDDKQWLTARIASNFRYRIKNVLHFTDYLVVYPSLDRVGEYQLRNEAALTSALGSDWSLRLANIFERDSNPPDDIKKDDIQWILGLQYEFNL